MAIGEDTDEYGQKYLYLFDVLRWKYDLNFHQKHQEKKSDYQEFAFYHYHKDWD